MLSRDMVRMIGGAFAIVLLWAVLAGIGSPALLIVGFAATAAYVVWIVRHLARPR